MFDFETTIDRRAVWSRKWNTPDGTLPMTVADMDFPTAPCIQEALQERMAQGCYGYTLMPKAWTDACLGWNLRRHGVQIPADNLLFSTGVITALSCVMRTFTKENDQVVMLTPVYHTFFKAIRANNRVVREVPMLYQQHAYSIDWEALTAALAEPMSRLMIVCNPHNPTGCCWDRETLTRIGHLCAEHDVRIFSDEIHSDLTDPGVKHQPFAALDAVCQQNSIIAISPSKTFNLGGLHTAAIYSMNPALLAPLAEALQLSGNSLGSIFDITATIAAWEKGDAWLDALRDQLYASKLHIIQKLAEICPQIHILPCTATHMLWLDIRELTMDSRAFAAFLAEKSGLLLMPGDACGTGGEGFLRMNYAYPAVVLDDALDRFASAIPQWPRT